MRPRLRRAAGASTVALLTTISLLLIACSSALAAAPRWSISASSGPTILTAGSSGDTYVITATNTGAAATAEGEPITITAGLAAGLKATGISGMDLGKGSEMTCESVPVLACTYTGAPVIPGELLRVTVEVEVEATAPAAVEDTAAVSGAGAGVAQTTLTSEVTPTPTTAPFELLDFASEPSSDQAGAHANLTTSFTVSQGQPDMPAANPRELELGFPAGLVGNASAVARCPIAELPTDGCPSAAAVGEVTLVNSTANSNVPEARVLLIYNVTPEGDEPAAFAFGYRNRFVARLDTRIRSEGDYGLDVSIHDISEGEPLLSASITLWGVPMEHNGPGPDLDAYGRSFGGQGEQTPTPFLANPTMCPESPAEAPETTVQASSWPGARAPEATESKAPFPALTGCGAEPFAPTAEVAPEKSSIAGAPTGYDVDVRVPQDESAAGLAAPDLQRIAVTLPHGTVVSPAGADGLVGCSPAEFALHSGALGRCPQASTIGTVVIDTPLLATPLEGEVLLGSPECSPCGTAEAEAGRMLPLLIQASGSGVVVKLRGFAETGGGGASAGLAPGDVRVVFDEAPELPFSNLSIRLNGGSRALLANPDSCAPIAGAAQLRPRLATSAAPLREEPPGAVQAASPPFALSGCGPPSFAPSFSAGMLQSARGGTYSPLAVTFARTDQEQALGAISVRFPPGIQGELASVAQCPEPQASQGACPSASRIGAMTLSSGPGPSPLWLGGGAVYLTGPYGGEPFGLSIVVPVIAGPLNLGEVVVRASIAVDPYTAALTITTGPLPQILAGIPLQLKTVDLALDRSQLMLNATDCDAGAFAGTITGAQGALAPVSSPYQAVDCTTLPFKPKLTALTEAKVSLHRGASLHIKILSGAGQANLARVRVDLPKQLPARLTTLQLACTNGVFDANPARCPPGSLVGTGAVLTPLLKTVLQGPVYLVSRGGSAFPDIVAVLQGEGVTLVLDGRTEIKHGITSATFETIPDSPIDSFDLVLPEGPHSIFGANLPVRARHSMCAQRLAMPTSIVAQDGATVGQSTSIAISGCRRARALERTRKARPVKRRSRARTGRAREHRRP